ncbi:MAG: hypothetical protein QXR53_04555 [Candidatus Norongarragalinales archaeon]
MRSQQSAVGRVSEKPGAATVKDRIFQAEKMLRSMEGETFLVEGKHDVRALRALGVRARLVQANGPPQAIAERIPARKVFLLLDFDREGLRKQRFFKTFLEEQGFSVDAVFARKLRRALGFARVEEIERKYADLKQKGELHGKNVR